MVTNKDFDTSHLSLRQRKIAEQVVTTAKFVFGESLSGGGCIAFYTPDEWRAKGEDYGHDAELIVVHDGGDLAPFFNYSYESYKMMSKMRKALAEMKLFPEQCTSWYSAIYKL